MCHTVTSNIFELLTLISNLFDNRRKWKFDVWKTVNLEVEPTQNDNILGATEGRIKKVFE